MNALAELDAIVTRAPRSSRVGRAAWSRGVRHSAEWERINALPRREWSEADAAALAAEMTPLLRQPGSAAELRPIQAVALLEIGMYRGLLAPVRAGAGKTLISLLAPYVLRAQRPVILLPAKLRTRTQDWMRSLLRDWRIAYWVHLVSYEELGRVSRATFLEDLQCDCLIADEGHKLKNPRAACTRRVKRFCEKYPLVPYIDMSGTTTKRSILDFANRSKWALGFGSPVPITHGEQEEWSSAVDESPRSTFRTEPGALAEWSESGRLSDVRAGLQKRITETPGVVATYDRLVGCSLVISRVEVPHCPKIIEGFKRLREKGETPDGWPTLGGLDDARHAREMCLGFYYRWSPRAPEEWLHRRREWGAFVRYVIRHNRSGIDSELAVAQAVDLGKIDCHRVAEQADVHPDARARWREIKASFVPNQETIWLSDVALEECAKWAKDGGLIWCEHVAFANELSRRTGLPYAGAAGVTRDGKSLESLAGRTAIASIASNQEGRNLQAWQRGLVTAPMSLGATWEQLLARWHRDGQLADEVSCDVLSGCVENERAFLQARADARYIGKLTGQEQRLSYASILWDPPTGTDARWQ